MKNDWGESFYVLNGWDNRSTFYNRYAADGGGGYATIDEVHHAHAPTYRRVMARLNCAFVLGLTATPERGDGIDVASIFDDKQCCSQFFVVDRSAGQMLGAR